MDNDKSQKAPTNNGIKELDNLCKKYNAGEIDLSQLICTVWNKALYLGGQEPNNEKNT